MSSIFLSKNIAKSSGESDESTAGSGGCSNDLKVPNSFLGVDA